MQNNPIHESPETHSQHDPGGHRHKTTGRDSHGGWSALDSTLGENITNIVAHVLYGLAIQLMAEEPPRQPDHRRSSDVERAAARVG